MNPILWNANGLKQHSYALLYLIHNKNIDIALITETHLSKLANINFNGNSTTQLLELTIPMAHPMGVLQY